MKNNKGFSILELIVSFTLTMIIVVILFEIIIFLKNLYENSVTKSELISIQNRFTDYIYSDINDLGLSGISMCGNNCVQFSYRNGDIKNLSWEYDYDEVSQKQSFQKIKYDEYAVDLIANSKFDLSLETNKDSVYYSGAKFCSSYSSSASYRSIKIPILNSKFDDEDFGINIIYVIDELNNDVYIDLPYSTGC